MELSVRIYELERQWKTSILVAQHWKRHNVKCFLYV